ncbi:MAG: Uma2 family endonuclease [Candidatus Electrothrix communis]|nr:MAG: Uma2 family endonuclease [Candidatus Electrothrix communis]
MEWNQVLEHPSLQNIPFKVELNEWGNIVMTPASNLHGNLQVKIAMKLMLLLKEGEVSAEVSIQTSKNIKVADVAWASAEFISQHGFETPYSMAPEICIEVISPGNTKGEMAEKRELYLGQGCKGGVVL